MEIEATDLILDRSGILVARPEADVALRGSRIGGLPAVDANFVWPVCVDHAAPMRFVAQFDIADRLVGVFYCEVEPGLCETWDADAGCNSAIVTDVASPLSLAVPPAGIVPPIDPPMTVALIVGRADAVDVKTAARRAGWEPIGRWGGELKWLQGDETPSGTSYIATLANTPLGFEFGDGWAYVFISDDGAGAKTLFQC